MIKKILLSLLVMVFAVSCAPAPSYSPAPQPTIDLGSFISTPQPSGNTNQAIHDLAIATIKANLNIATYENCSDEEVIPGAGLEADLFCIYQSSSTAIPITVSILKFDTLDHMNEWMSVDLKNNNFEIQDVWHYKGSDGDSGRLYVYHESEYMPTVAWTLDDHFIYVKANRPGSKDSDFLFEWWKTTGSSRPSTVQNTEQPNFKEAINTIESNLKIANYQNCVYEQPNTQLGFDARFLCMVTYYVGSGSVNVGVDIYKFSTPEKMEAFITNEIKNETLNLNDYWNYAGESVNSGRIFGFTENNRTATLAWTIDNALIYARSSTKDMNNPDLLLNWWKEFGSAKN